MVLWLFEIDEHMWLNVMNIDKIIQHPDIYVY